VVQRYSRSHSGARRSTLGTVVHASRSGKAGNPPDAEYEGTISYCSNPANEASYHAIIHRVTGNLAEIVPPGSAAWHAEEMNQTHLGVAFAQAVEGEPISEAAIKSLAWYIRTYHRGMYGLPYDPSRIVQHKDTEPGPALGQD
jgi:N-acetylmuramoyl-L-alanine amidase CwlA